MTSEKTYTITLTEEEINIIRFALLTDSCKWLSKAVSDPSDAKTYLDMSNDSETLHKKFLKLTHE